MSNKLLIRIKGKCLCKILKVYENCNSLRLRNWEDDVNTVEICEYGD